MRLPDRPSPAVAAAGLATAYGAFGVVFRGPRERFWARMTRTGVGLAALAVATDRDLRSVRPGPRDVALGVGLAAGLAAATRVGESVARRVMPDAVADVRRLRTLRPTGELAVRLAVLGPAEELFWRGAVQSALTRRLGPVRGAAAATAAYGGAHLPSCNPALIGAAAGAGGAWSALAALGVPMPALMISHGLWDLVVFLAEGSARPAGA